MSQLRLAIGRSWRFGGGETAQTQVPIDCKTWGETGDEELERGLYKWPRHVTLWLHGDSSLRPTVCNNCVKHIIPSLQCHKIGVMYPHLYRWGETRLREVKPLLLAGG